MAESTEVNWVEQIGRPAYESIAEMVAALKCDYDRLEELREERNAWEPMTREEVEKRRNDGGLTPPESWADQNPDDAEELAELEAAAVPCGNECKSEDDAREMIQSDALSVRVFGERTNGEWEADKFEILLTTGGPAVRIVGELDGGGEPDRAWLEVQDWFKPWMQYFQADQDTLLAYCRCFYFGE